MKTFKKRLRIILWLSIVLILSSVTAFAAENINSEFVLENNEIKTNLDEQVTDSIIEYNYTDEHGNLISATEINTFASNSVLWNQSYENQYSVKKEINAKNYGIYAKPGKVNVYIKNTGNTPINVNIYINLGGILGHLIMERFHLVQVKHLL